MLSVTGAASRIASPSPAATAFPEPSYSSSRNVAVVAPSPGETLAHARYRTSGSATPFVHSHVAAACPDTTPLHPSTMPAAPAAASNPPITIARINA